MTKRKLASAIAKREGGVNNTRIEDIMQVLTRAEEIEAEELFAGNEGVTNEQSNRVGALMGKLERTYAKSPFIVSDDRKAFLAAYRAKQAPAKSGKKAGKA